MSKIYKITIGVLMTALLPSIVLHAQDQNQKENPTSKDSSSVLPDSSGTLSPFEIAFDSTAYQYAQTITARELSQHLHILASDDYEGRETGEAGQKRAALYITQNFRKWGLKPVGTKNSYEQKFKMVEKKVKSIEISTSGKKSSNYEEWKDFIMFERDYMPLKVKTEIIAVAISDIAKEEFDPATVKGKAVLLVEPAIPDGVTPKSTAIETLYDAGAVVIFNAYTNKPEFEVNERFKHYLDKGKLFFINEKVQVTYPIISTTHKMAARLFGMKEKKYNKLLPKLSAINDKWKKKFKPTKINIQIEIEDRLIHTENVVGLIEGTDKKDEIVVLSAHYDHIGVKDDTIVYNGADDDGSGTVAIMEMAQAFAKAKKDGNGPRRSILIIGMTGEEKGLLGSEYYSNHPIFPLENTVTNLNTDMIGRLDPKHEEAMDSNYVYLIGTNMLSTDLHRVSEGVNNTYKNINLDYRYNNKTDDEQFYYRSDHYNFAKNGIPVIFYFTGVHADYHKPTDTVDKIMFKKVENITQLIFYTAWEIANREERLKVDVEE